MNIILPIDIIAAVIFIFTPIIIFIIYRLIIFPIWRVITLRKHDNDKWYGRWERFIEDNIAFWIPVFGSVLVSMVAVICVCMMGITISENHTLEPQTYAAYETEYKTLNEIIETTDDIVNTKLYLRINEYNKEVTTFQSQYNNPSLRFNFTGDYNWNTLPLINLKDGS